MKTFLNVVLLVLMLAPATSFAGDVISFQPGIYGNLTLGYDPQTKSVTGYYWGMGGVDDDKWTCSFFLAGTPGGAVHFFDPASPQNETDATLTAAGPKAVSLTLKDDDGQCGQLGINADEPAKMDLDTPRPYRAVRIVKSRRAYFYPSAEASAPGKLFVIHDQAVGILAQSGDRLEAEYRGDKPVTGWIRSSEFYPLP